MIIRFLILVIFLTSASVAQDLQKQMEDHFKRVRPELYRYRGLTIYGETISETRISASEVEEETRLFQNLTGSGLLQSPTKEVIALCHNLLVYDSITGNRFLEQLSGLIENEDVEKYLPVGCLVSGSYGEQLAVSKLRHTEVSVRRYWSGYLRRQAIYNSSVNPILEAIKSEKVSEIKANLLHALSAISDPSTLRFLESVVKTTRDDEVQAAAIFAYVELAGFDGVSFLETTAPVGEESRNELQSGIQWLAKETSAQSRFGFSVSSDLDFVERFGGLRRSPVIKWLDRAELLSQEAVENPRQLTTEEKRELFELLMDSKGFGLEAVKGALFESLEKEDLDQLLRLRSAVWYSPNEYSRTRAKTIQIMIRFIRKTL